MTAQPNLLRNIDLLFYGSYDNCHPLRSKLLLDLSKAVLGWQGGYSLSYYLINLYELDTMPIGVAMYAQPASATTDLLSVFKQSKSAIYDSSDRPTEEKPEDWVFEAIKCGVLIFTNNNSSLVRFFEPENEIMVYESSADLVNKLRNFLDYPEQLAKIATRAQARVASE